MTPTDKITHRDIEVALTVNLCTGVNTANYICYNMILDNRYELCASLCYCTMKHKNYFKKNMTIRADEASKVRPDLKPVCQD